MSQRINVLDIFNIGEYHDLVLIAKTDPINLVSYIVSDVQTLNETTSTKSEVEFLVKDHGNDALTLIAAMKHIMKVKYERQ